MGWLDKLLKKRPSKTKYAVTLDGMMPIFGQYGTDVYESDVVQQALKCIVDEMKKLNPMHIKYDGRDPVPVVGDIQRVLTRPNRLMTTSEFIEKITWLLLLNYNSFIIPTYYEWKDEKGIQRKVYKSLYPIKPTQVDFIEDAAEKLYVKFTFMNGETATVPHDSVIHLKYNYSVNEYMGGNEQGQPNHESLLATVNLNRKLLEGIAKAMNASYSVNGVVKYNTMMDEEKTIKALQEMERKLENSESGFLPLDLKSEFIPLERRTEFVDDATLRFIDEKILRNWGVPLCILKGDFTKEQYEAFYQKALEPLIVSYSQGFSKTLFTQEESDEGNRIEFYPEQLTFLTMTQKLEMINMLSPTGALFENEKRTILGMMPLPELTGKRYISLNWINSDDASRYQKGTDE